LGAEKLVFLSDIPGVLRDKTDPSSLFHSLTAEEARRLIREGVIVGGMIPKVEGCLATLAKGVRKVHIVDGRVRIPCCWKSTRQRSRHGVGTGAIGSGEKQLPRPGTPGRGLG